METSERRAITLNGQTRQLTFEQTLDLLYTVRHELDQFGGVSQPKPTRTVKVDPRRRSVITPKKRFAVLERDHHKCRYCGAGVTQAGELVIDHIKSLRDGGTDDIDNLAAACWECNAGKGGRSL